MASRHLSSFATGQDLTIVGIRNPFLNLVFSRLVEVVHDVPAVAHEQNRNTDLDAMGETRFSNECNSGSNSCESEDNRRKQAFW